MKQNVTETGGKKGQGGLSSDDQPAADRPGKGLGSQAAGGPKAGMVWASSNTSCLHEGSRVNVLFTILFGRTSVQLGCDRLGNLGEGTVLATRKNHYGVC